MTLCLPIQVEANDTPPNVLLIIADDLGFSDIGAYGSEIPTPNIDDLAKQGAMFSSFYALPTCAPSRSVIFTGTENHIAGFGSQIPTERQRPHDGYQGELSENVRTIPEVLRPAGYRTYFAGKWHLGDEEGHLPIDRGFDETFALMYGGGSHYADLYPLHPGEPMIYRRNGEIVTDLPDDFYSTQYYADALLEWLERDKDNPTPFFASFSMTAPHDPLHAPAEYIKKYEGDYDAGYQVLQKERFQRLKSLGLIPDSQDLPPWPKVVAEWEDLPPEQQALKRRDMEIYAAMIDYLDEQIGRILQWLKVNGEYDNTLIIFMSDNGANGLSKTIYAEYSDEFAANFDNSLENRGLPGSYVSLDGGWATAATPSFKFFKGFTTEGGIRVPAVFKLPAGTQNDRAAGEIIENMSHARDIMPTILELAGVEHPSIQDSSIEHVRGKSLVDLITGESDLHYEDGEGIGYELHGARAYIEGDWKIIQTPMPIGDGRWHLYNISEDPAETTNLATQHMDIRDRLIAAHENYEEQHGVVFDYVLLMGPVNTLHKYILVLLGGIAATAVLSAANGWYRRLFADQAGPSRLLVAALGALGLLGVYLIWGDGYHIGLYLYGALITVWLLLLIRNRGRWFSYATWLIVALMISAEWFMTSGLALGRLVE